MSRYNDIKKASILGIVGNIFLFVIKAIIGFVTKSQSMIADSFNSASDILSSLMTYIGNKIASKPRDKDHNLGHGKAEYIYSMLISITIIIVSVLLFKDSLLILIHKQKYTFSIWLIIVCIITIGIKFSLYIYTNELYKKHNNLLIKANSKDHINDCLVTTLNLVSCILSLFNIFIFDGIVGMLISLWMLKSAISIYLESYNVLMDKAMNSEEKRKVLEIVSSHSEIVKTNHFNSTPVGYKYQVSLTIFVDGNLSTFESHKIADDLEKEIINEIEEVYLVIIHVNPIEIEKKKTKKAKDDLL